MINAKDVVKYVMPHGLVMQVLRSQAVRRRLTVAHNRTFASVARQQVPYSYSAAIEFHSAKGLPRGQLIGGSMPESTLAIARSLSMTLSCARTIGLLSHCTWVIFSASR
jgi:hypothetical protein